MQRFKIAWPDASMLCTAYAVHAFVAGHADSVYDSQLLEICNPAASCEPY